MRRTAAAFVGFAALLVFAACTDRTPQQPLAPTQPSFASSPQCSGNFASQIAKDQKDLFSDPALQDLEDRFDVIKSLCPSTSINDAAFLEMMSYLDAMISYRTAQNMTGLAGHLHSITLYVTGTGLVRPNSVFGSNGGADVLTTTTTSGDELITFDKGAQLVLAANTNPAGPIIFTFEPKPTSACDGTTSLRVVGPGNAELRGVGSNCYEVKDFPHATSYTPPATLTLCMKENFGETGIVHQKSGFGGEVLPEVFSTYSCAPYHMSQNSWLRPEAGAIRQVLARAYDYLRPRPLFADDAGETGSIGDFSLVGGILNVIFEDDFQELLNPPDVGDNWIVQATSPGYIRINETGLGDLPGPIVELSQAQGNCENCPVFRLLGTRVNAGDAETIGTYQISWSSLQNKPNVKEAPFVVLNGTGNGSKEIARLSYVTESSQNYLRYNGAIVRDALNNPVTWTQNQHQNFMITVRLTDLDPATPNFTTSLAINGITYVTDAPFKQNTNKFTAIGYVLDGIDAGIIGADNFLVIRLPDIPPTP
jgi:hypothetical protein